jgi:hypothetical protein
LRYLSPYEGEEEEDDYSLTLFQLSYQGRVLVEPKITYRTLWGFFCSLRGGRGGCSVAVLAWGE